MRYTLALILLAFASASNAATLSFSRQVNMPSPEPPLTIKWELLNRPESAGPPPADGSATSPYSFTQTVTPADSGSTWTIDASNAASYGLDWAAVKTASESFDWRWVEVEYGTHFVQTYSLGNLELSGEFITSFSLTRVVFEMPSYVAGSPIQNQIDFRSTTVGEGTTVPEPSAAAMLGCVAMSLAGACRRRGRSG